MSDHDYTYRDFAYVENGVEKMVKRLAKANPVYPPHLERDEWLPVTEEVEWGGPYLVTNNPKAKLNDGTMSHVWVVRRIFREAGGFCAFNDSLDTQKIYGITHYWKITPPEVQDD